MEVRRVQEIVPHRVGHCAGCQRAGGWQCRSAGPSQDRQGLCEEEHGGVADPHRLQDEVQEGLEEDLLEPEGRHRPAGEPGCAGPEPGGEGRHGKVLGKFLGLFPAGYRADVVEIDGGSYMYAPNGVLVYPFGSGSPAFKTNACNGTAYVRSSSPQNTQLITGSPAVPTRLVYRKMNRRLGRRSRGSSPATIENRDPAHVHVRRVPAHVWRTRPTTTVPSWRCSR